MTATDRTDMLKIEENVPLAPFTSFGIGGPARWLVEAATVQELQAALAHARRNGLAWYVLAGGTNILVSDRGLNGLVIHMKLDAIAVSETVMTAQAGADLGQTVDRAAEHGLTGMECLAGIPGTVGGAVRGNAGAYGTTIGELVTRVLAVDADTLEHRTLAREECGFAYRTSLFKRFRNLVVVEAELGLERGNPEEIRQKMADVLKKRGAIMENEMSVGSYFMNPIPTDEQLIKKFETDRQIVCRNCMIPAGWFIDQAGLRGTRVGGAMVSEKHGNYLINTGSATAEDVLQLAALIKRQVRETMGVELQEEVNYVGF